MAIETESVFIGERTDLKALIRSGEVDAAGDTALAVRSPMRIFVEAHLGRAIADLGEESPVSVREPKEIKMDPEAAEAVRIADKHLAGHSIERRKALALDIMDAIGWHAGNLAVQAIKEVCAKTRQ